MGSTPLPEGLAPQQAKLFGGALTDKVGLKVAAPSITIVDAPTTGVVAGQAVIGGYKIHDEGVAAQKVEAVKGGMLKTLLSARTQVDGDKGGQSNGHARRTAPGGAFHGTATNLIVSAKGGLAPAALKKKLLAEVRAAGLKYGLIIRQL